MILNNLLLICRAIYAIAFKRWCRINEYIGGEKLGRAGYIIFFKVKQQASYDRISENDEQDEDDLRETHDDRDERHEDREDFRLNGQGFIDEGEIKRIQEFLRNKVKMPKATGQDLNRKNSSTTSGELKILPIRFRNLEDF